MSSSKPPPRPDLRRLIRTYLRTGTRSRAETAAYLRQRGLSPTAAIDVTRDLQRSGALDDRACAKLWMQRLLDEGYAWCRIRERLREKQLSDRLIDALLADARPQDPDDGRARTIAAARLARLPASDPRRRARLARWLVSRGFDPDLIEQVLAELLADPVSYDD
jgi:SOS response regulatory protein OraA/RecX